MPRISRRDYEEYHESTESLRGERDIHPALRRLWPRLPAPVCRACGFEPYDGLTEDGLCGACDKTVKDLEEGKI